MKKLYFFLITVLFLLFIGGSLNAQQTVFWRSNASTSNWWDSNNPWYRSCDGWWIDRPNYNSCNSNSVGRTWVNIDNNNQLTMNVNGTYFDIKSLTLKSGASSARTFNAASGGGINVDAGISNEDNNSNTHTFNVPIALGASCSFNSNNATFSFTSNFYLNTHTATFSGNHTISAIISESGGSGSIIKNGAGIITLSGANTYTGLTTVSEGTLRLNRTGGSTLPNTNSITINGGTLRVSSNQTIANLTMSSGTLTIDAGVTLTVTGTYNVTGGTLTNNGILCRPSNPPTISAHPTSTQTICQNATPTNLAVTASTTSGGNLTYQWFSNTTNSNSGGTSLGSTSGAQTATYTPPTTALGTIYYYVVVTNACSNTVNSNVAAVTVNAPPSTPSVTAGGATTFCAGGSVTLTSNASSGNQWYKDGAIISGETNTTYTATTSGSYTVIATVGCASSPSSATSVTVNPRPTVSISNQVNDPCMLGAGQVTVTGSGGTGALSITWTATAHPSRPVGATGSATGTPSGASPSPSPTTYTNLTGWYNYNFLVTDANGCTATQ